MAELIERGPRLPGRRRLRRRLLRRAVLAGVRRAVQPAHRRHGGRRGRRPARQARPARLRAVEGPQGGRARDARRGRRRGAAAGRAGTSSARRWSASTSAPEFDIHGGGLDLRFPHHENELAQSTRGRPAVRPLLDAQRDAQPRRLEDEQVGRQHAARLRGRQAGPADRRCATTWSRRTTARSSSSPRRRSTRPRRRTGGSRASCGAATEVLGDERRPAGGVDCRRASPTAMDDDLVRPGARWPCCRA